MKLRLGLAAAMLIALLCSPNVVHAHNITVEVRVAMLLNPRLRARCGCHLPEEAQAFVYVVQNGNERRSAVVCRGFARRYIGNVPAGERPFTRACRSIGIHAGNDRRQSPA